MNEEEIKKQFTDVATAFFYLGAWAGYEHVYQQVPIVIPDQRTALKEIAEDFYKIAKETLEDRHSSNFPDQIVWETLFHAMYANMDMFLKTGLWGGDIEANE